MAERMETDCQKINNNWLKKSQAAYLEIESLCQNKTIEEIAVIAASSSNRFLISFSQMGATIDPDYAAQGNGRLYWLAKTLGDYQKENSRNLTPDSLYEENNSFDLVTAQTFLAWCCFESFFVIKTFPIRPEEQKSSLDTLIRHFQFLNCILERYLSDLPYDFTAVHDDLLYFARSRIREATRNPEFDLDFPFRCHQKRAG